MTNTLTRKTEVFPTLRQAALSMAPEINTTGQTIKAYIENGKLFNPCGRERSSGRERGIYLIKYLNS